MPSGWWGGVDADVADHDGILQLWMCPGLIGQLWREVQPGDAIAQGAPPFAATGVVQATKSRPARSCARAIGRIGPERRVPFYVDAAPGKTTGKKKKAASRRR